MKTFCAPSIRSSASRCATASCYWNMSESLIDRKLSREIKHPKSGEVIVGAHKRISEALYKELVKATVTQAEIGVGRSRRRRHRRRAGESPDRRSAARSEQAAHGRNVGHDRRSGHHRSGHLLSRSATTSASSFRARSKRTPSARPKEALIEIYRKLRPGDPPTLETATALFNGMFFDRAQVRFQQSRPPEIQHQAGPGNAAR